MKSCLLTWWHLRVLQRPHHLFSYLEKFGPVTVFTMRGWRRSESVMRCGPPNRTWYRRFFVPSFLATRFAQLDRVNQWQRKRLFSDFSKEDADLHIVALAPDFPIPRKPRLLIYDCMDAWDCFSNARESVRENELRLCEQADRIWVVSRTLQERLHPRFGNKVLYVPNGVDVEHFREAVAYRRQRKTLSPTAICVGAIAEWFDARLVGEVAALLPQWKFKLVGPVYIPSEVAAYLQRPNIELLGARLYQELPALMGEASVGIIPFVINDLIKATSPIKLYEYLAAGLPVVSTPMPEVVSMQNPEVIACEETARGFAAAIARLGSCEVWEQAIAIATRHGWEARFAFGLQGLGL